MFANIDDAVHKGMLGGGVCMPWMLDLKLYCNAEGAAKMAAWGFYPHLVLGISRDNKSAPFPLDPDDEMYAFVQPYWRVLAHVDADKVSVFNLPSQSATAMTSSIPDVQGVVYKESEDKYLVVVANLGEAPVKSNLTLNADVLGLDGTYTVLRIDSTTSEAHPSGSTTNTLITAELPQWGIEGFVLTKK
jgi:hypothetical protein